MIKLVSAILALLLLAAPSHAKVLVYKGTVKAVTVAPPQPTSPNVFSLYFIVDPDTNQYSFVDYFTKNGKHHQVLLPRPIFLTSAAALAGKTKTAISVGNADFADAAHFNGTMLFLTGTNSTLRFTTLGAIQTTSFPKTFGGTQFYVGRDEGDGGFSQSQFVLGLQSKLTLEANDAGKTIAEVTDQISMDLQRKGYPKDFELP